MDSNESGKEVVDIIDKDGNVIGQATRSEVYKKGLLHPAVNIVVMNKRGQIFIQQRSAQKILPLYWDISASEHVKSGEDYKSAAEGKFVSFEKLNELIKNNQIKFSPWGIDELNYLINNQNVISELTRLI